MIQNKIFHINDVDLLSEDKKSYILKSIIEKFNEIPEDDYEVFGCDIEDILLEYFKSYYE